MLSRPRWWWRNVDDVVATSFHRCCTRLLLLLILSCIAAAERASDHLSHRLLALAGRDGFRKTFAGWRRRGAEPWVLSDGCNPNVGVSLTALTDGQEEQEEEECEKEDGVEYREGLDGVVLCLECVGHFFRIFPITITVHIAFDFRFLPSSGIDPKDKPQQAKETHETKFHSSLLHEELSPDETEEQERWDDEEGADGDEDGERDESCEVVRDEHVFQMHRKAQYNQRPHAHSGVKRQPHDIEHGKHCRPSSNEE